MQTLAAKLFPRTAAFRLDFIVPVILGATLCFDLAARALPFDPWSPDAMTAAARYRRLDGTFGRSHTYRAAHSYGGLVRMGRRADMLSYRPEQFTTDSEGYRNRAELKGKARIMLFGSSFTAGAALNDSDTLDAGIAARIGEPVYNAALPGHEYGFERINHVRKMLGVRRGLAIVECMNRFQVDTQTLQKPLTMQRRHEWLNRHLLTREVWPLFTGIRWPTIHVRLADRLAMAVENDRILPNASREAIARRLVNGQQMLFYRHDVAALERGMRAETAADAFEWLGKQLAPLGLDMVVALVPTAYTVYWPFIQGNERAPDPGYEYFQSLERELARRSIPTVNTVRALRQSAREEFGKGRYVYYLDDLHWNARGAAVASGEIAAYLKTGGPRGWRDALQ